MQETPTERPAAERVLHLMKPSLGVVIPAGPGEDVADTIDSVVTFGGDRLQIVVVDDSDQGPSHRVALAGISHRVLVVPAPAGARGGRGGLWVKIAFGLKALLEVDDPDVILRMDTDALMIAAGFSEEADRALRRQPRAGVLGAVAVGPDGGARDWSPAARMLAAERGLRGWRHPALRAELRGRYQDALGHRYTDGEHALGGAYVLSPGFAHWLCEPANVDHRRFAPSALGEDHIVGLLCRAAGFTLAELSGPGDPMAIKWRGLPSAPEDLLAGHARVVHSIRSFGERREIEIRAAFAGARQAPAQAPSPDRDLRQRPEPRLGATRAARDVGRIGYGLQLARRLGMSAVDPSPVRLRIASSRWPVPPARIVCIYRKHNGARVRSLIDDSGLPASLWALDEPDRDLARWTVGTGPGHRLELLNRLIASAPINPASRDSGPSDSGPSDSGPSDSGPSDSGPSDSGPSDSGASLSGPPDDEFLVVADDDVTLRRGGLTVALRACAHLGIDLAQPANGALSHCSWDFNRFAFGSLARRTLWVEQGPIVILGPRARLQLLPLPTALGMGWGLEVLWSQSAQHDLTAGIIDGVRMRHRGRVATAYDRSASEAQGRRLLAEHGVAAYRDLQVTLSSWHL